jgi:hypothetical protein
MRFSLDTLDDEILLAVQDGTLGGQVSNALASQLNPTQATHLRDIVIDTLGISRSRRGFHKFGELFDLAPSTYVQGLWFYESTAKQVLLAMVDGFLWEIDSAGTATLVDNGGEFVLPIYLTAEDGSRVTAEDGSWIVLNDPVHITGTSRTGAAYFSQVGDKVFFTTGEANEYLHQYDGTSITDDATSQKDGLSRLVAQAYRVFGVRNRDELHVTKILPNNTEGLFGVGNNSIQVGDGDGDRIQALFAWLDTNLAVFKRSSTFIVNTDPAAVTGAAEGTGAAGFSVKKISDRVGCVAPRTAAQVGQDVLFLARDGVRSLQRTLTEGMSSVGPALSFPIDDLIRLIDWENVDTASAYAWRTNYFLSVPVVGMDTDRIVLVLNGQAQAWTWFSGISPLFWCPIYFDGQPEKLLMLDASGQLMEYRDWVAENTAVSNDFKDEFNADEYSPAPWNYRSRAFNFDFLLRNKQLDFVEIEFDKSRALVDVWLWTEGARTARIASMITTGTEQLTLPQTLPFTFPIERVVRKRFGLLKYGGVREAMIEIVETEVLSDDEQADSFNLGVRRVFMGAFEDPYEVDE